MRSMATWAILEYLVVTNVTFVVVGGAKVILAAAYRILPKFQSLPTGILSHNQGFKCMHRKVCGAE